MHFICMLCGIQIQNSRINFPNPHLFVFKKNLEISMYNKTHILRVIDVNKDVIPTRDIALVRDESVSAYSNDTRTSL